MTTAEFLTQIAVATTAEELRTIVDEFAPTFASMSNSERAPIRVK